MQIDYFDDYFRCLVKKLARKVGKKVSTRFYDTEIGRAPNMYLNDLETALRKRLGRRVVIETRGNIVYVSPDGYDEYLRRKALARELWAWYRWPEDWYDRVVKEKIEFDDDDIWKNDYSDTDFWDFVAKLRGRGN